MLAHFAAPRLNQRRPICAIAACNIDRARGNDKRPSQIGDSGVLLAIGEQLAHNRVVRALEQQRAWSFVANSTRRSLSVNSPMI
jgi:hypothetical protein